MRAPRAAEGGKGGATSPGRGRMSAHHTRLRIICAPIVAGGSSFANIDNASRSDSSTTYSQGAAVSSATAGSPIIEGGSAARITPGQREEFSKSGFLVIPGALAASETAKYRALAATLVDRASALHAPSGDSEAGYSFSLESFEGTPVPGFLHKVQGVNTYESAFNEIARHPSILPKVQELLGSPELDIFGTKFFPKLPATDALPTGGISVNWHQDNFAFGADVQQDRAKQEQIISMAIYLEDSDQENGCFQVVPGSHCHGFLPPPRQVSQNSAELLPQHLALPADAEPLAEPLAVPCTAGTAVLFSANLLHSALPNRSASRSRFGLFWHYLPRDVQPNNFRSADYADRHEL